MVTGTSAERRSVETASVTETEAAGARLARTLRPGDLLLLAGEMGSGKTALARGIAAGLGTRGHVQSPTFQLVRVYPGPVPMAHADLHRLGATVDLRELGLEELLETGVVVVEWGDRLRPAPGLSEGLIEIRLPRSGGADWRRIRILRGPGRWSW